MGPRPPPGAANDALVVGTEPWSIQGHAIRFGSREEFDAGARRTTPGACVLPFFPQEISFSCGSCLSWFLRVSAVKCHTIILVLGFFCHRATEITEDKICTKSHSCSFCNSV